MLKTLCALLLGSALAISQSPAKDAIASGETTELPAPVAAAVRQAVQDRWDIDSTQLQITAATPRLWSDGCLGLAPPGQFCQEVLMKGWQVTVTHNRLQWVYRSNTSGSLVMWDQARSKPDRLFTLQSQPFPEEQQPQKLPKKALFRSILYGGEGAYRETVLLKNGQVLERTASETPLANTRKIDPDPLKDFRKLLKQERFHQFHNLCYLAPEPPGTGEKIVVTSRDTTVCYSGNSPQLPSDLETVMAAWTQLIQPR